MIKFIFVSDESKKIVISRKTTECFSYVCVVVNRKIVLVVYTNILEEKAYSIENLERLSTNTLLYYEFSNFLINKKKRYVIV